MIALPTLFPALPPAWKRYPFLVLLVLMALPAIGQDIQYSQFYGSPLYNNPAFAGSSHYFRGMLHSRIQWPSISNSYYTNLAAVDHFIQSANSGVGIYFLDDRQGDLDNPLRTNIVAGQYSYELHLNREWSVRAAGQVSVHNRNVSNNFTQPGDFEGFNAPNQASGDGSLNATFGNLGLGGLLYSEKAWFGVAGHNLPEPNQSLIGATERLPAMFTLSGGYRIELEHQRKNILHKGRRMTISPVANYKFQGKSDQLDVGVYAVLSHFLAGFWYRGIEFKRLESDLRNSESVVAMVGAKINDYITVRYSYDATISLLNEAPVYSGGAHEINITYVNNLRKRHQKPMKRLPCPDFFHY